MNRLSLLTCIRRCLLLILPTGLLLCGHAGAQPQPWAPSGASSFEPGQSMSVDGLPLRIQGFVTADPPDQVLRAARTAAKGLPVAESMLRGRPVLGWLEAGHYITVQVEPAGAGGTRGLWSAVPVSEGLRARPPAAPQSGWFPAGSELAPAVRMRDGPIEGLVLQAFNAHSPQANSDHLVRRLRSEGFDLERPRRSNTSPGSEPEESVLLFQGARGAQATAVLLRESAGRTAVTLVMTGPKENR